MGSAYDWSDYEDELAREMEIAEDEALIIDSRATNVLDPGTRSYKETVDE